MRKKVVAFTAQRMRGPLPIKQTLSNYFRQLKPRLWRFYLSSVDDLRAVMRITNARSGVSGLA
jgi:hypothetical protein